MIAPCRVNHSPDMPLSLPRVVLSLENLAVEKPVEAALPRHWSLNGLHDDGTAPAFNHFVAEDTPTVDPPQTPTKETHTARTVDLSDSHHSTTSTTSHNSSPIRSPRRDRVAVESELHKNSMVGSWSHAVALALFHRHLHMQIGAPIGASVHMLEDVVKNHFRNLPERYSLSISNVEDVIDHMTLMREASQQLNFRVLVRKIVDAPADVNRVQVTITCPDKAKIYNLITSVLDRVSTSTQDGDIMTSKTGIVLDRFIVDAYPHYTPELLAATISSSLNPGATPQILREIGRGLTCITYEALAANSTSIILKRPIQPSVEDVASFTREAQLMQSLPPHPNICSYVSANLQPDNLYICYEYLSGGSLANLIQTHKLSVDDIVSILLQVARGMLFLHSHHVLHRDLKSTNVMLDSNGVAKICDFGISRYEAADMTAETGTYRWMAPEVIRHERYGAAADVYSFAILAWELLAHSLPYANMTPVQAAFCVAKDGLRPDIPVDTPPALSALVRACWDRVPEKRPSFLEVVESLKEM